MTINETCNAINKDVRERLDAIKYEQEKLDVLKLARVLLQELQRIENLPNCNTCLRQGCEYKPKLGEYTRFNCPLHKDSAV